MISVISQDYRSMCEQSLSEVVEELPENDVELKKVSISLN